MRGMDGKDLHVYTCVHVCPWLWVCGQWQWSYGSLLRLMNLCEKSFPVKNCSPYYESTPQLPTPHTFSYSIPFIYSNLSNLMTTLWRSWATRVWSLAVSARVTIGPPSAPIRTHSDPLLSRKWRSQEVSIRPSHYCVTYYAASTSVEH